MLWSEQSYRRMIEITFANPRKIIAEVRKEIRKELLGFGNDLFNNLKSFTPIKKGRARRGWVKAESNNSVKLKNGVPYIERLEANYSKQTRGRGIVKPAIAQTRAGRQRRVR